MHPFTERTSARPTSATLRGDEIPNCRDQSRLLVRVERNGWRCRVNKEPGDDKRMPKLLLVAVMWETNEVPEFEEERLLLG
jgi:hypothetical protein